MIAATLCRLLGHKKVRVIDGFHLDHVTASGVLGGTVTSEHWECQRCGVRVFRYREQL